jgi:hypothetical protein
LWLDEIKHDGFRIIARKTGKRVRLYSRQENDLTWRFPLVVEGVALLRSHSCIIDGETVACDDEGIANFELIGYRHNDDSVFLYAFDLIELDGDVLRPVPLTVPQNDARQRHRASSIGLAAQRAPRRRRPACIPSCLQHGPRGHSVEAQTHVFPGEKIPKDMLELASHIVEAKAGHFDPNSFEDQYEDALIGLIRTRKDGQYDAQSPCMRVGRVHPYARQVYRRSATPCRKM